MFTPDRVTVPLVVFVSTLAPAMIPLTVPLCRFNAVAVSAPVVPLIVPLLSVTVASVLLNVVRLNAPPLIVSVPAAASAFVTPSASVPAEIVVPPV